MSHIELNSVSLRYPIYDTSAQSLKRKILTSVTGGGLIKTEKNHVLIDALSDISFSLHDGDRLGLIGHNGAGKSSLLRLIAGIYEPSYGTLTVNGKISTLLDTSLGMEPEATGYENIRLRGLVLGLSNKEIQAITPDIAAFTEIENYLPMPVKTYSSGMVLRLAFGISTAIHPEILLIDEVIGAGDAHFLEKAKARLRNLIHRANIIVLSSHDLIILRTFCNKMLWLDRGTMKAFGNTNKVLDQYEKAIEKPKILEDIL